MTTVYHSLVDKGHLSQGDKILIHSAAGAVGQAAIILAHHLGAEVFATVGSQAKRAFLQETYGIPADHFFSSRTTDFARDIKHATDGYGVDVVLNSLSGEAFPGVVHLCCLFGRFVEIGRKDLMDDALMPMEFLLKNVTFSYVDLAMITEERKSLAEAPPSNVITHGGGIHPACDNYNDAYFGDRNGISANPSYSILERSFSRSRRIRKSR